MNVHSKSKTKIIATIGPATASEDRLRELIMEGIDVCRLNFSHGSQEQHGLIIEHIRKLNNELHTNIALMGDLQGPKIRLGMMEEEGIVVHDNDEIVFTNKDCKGNRERVFISYQNFPNDIKKGDTILLDDGKLKFEVISSDKKTDVRASTIHGGKLFSRKGINLPDTKISIPSLTEKDIDDVHFMLDHNLDWIALSFVRQARDIRALKEIIRQRGKHTLVMAKIEKPEALNEIDQIIDEADAVMIARGDLGVEVSFDKVPFIQKQIVQKCIGKSKPVVIATQMLESMITNFRPTRAEANDVANAVFDCADTVMLSGETSVGKYPVEAIRSMQKIIDYAEGTEFVLNHEHIPDLASDTYIPDTVCYNACKMADQSGAKAIITFTSQPQAGFRLASNRPNAPVFLFTPDRQLLQQMSMVWGVRAFSIDPEHDTNSAFDYSINLLKNEKLISKGDILVHVSSTPLFDYKEVNTIKLSHV